MLSDVDKCCQESDSDLRDVESAHSLISGSAFLFSSPCLCKLVGLIRG